MDRYQELLGIKTVAGIAPEKALHHLGLLIDASKDGPHPEGLRQAIALADELAGPSLNPADASTLEYFAGNAWAGLGQAEAKTESVTWESQLEGFSKETTHFHRAVRSEGFTRLPSARRCQVFTNLGNAMFAMGRPIESKVWLFVHQLNDPTYRRVNRSPLTIRLDGTWTAVAKLSVDTDCGERFELRAVANPTEDVGPSSNAWGEFSEWPTGQWQSPVIEVRRKKNAYDPHS